MIEMVNRYVDLKPAGGRFMGVCPFHQETKPSMSVNPEQGFYYCFGCQASGDVIDFYCRINGLDFMDGLKELASEVGVSVSHLQDEQQGQKSGERKTALEMHALAQSYFRKGIQGPQGRAAREYLLSRGVDRTLSDHFALGWSPDSWQGLKDFLTQKGYTPEQGVTAGLLSQNASGRIYDRFRSRVVFPIHDLNGRIVAFGGRVIGDGEPKYLNSSESPIFKKGDLLYGLYQARKSVTQSKQVLLTEGYADVISMVQFGFVNACGVLGTALTAKQVQRLAGLSHTVILVFDGDRAGQEAALRSAEMILCYGLQVRVVPLPADDDVDSLLRREGAEALTGLIHRAEQGLAFCLSMITSHYSPKEVMSWAIRFLKGMQDVSFRAYYLPRLAEGLRISEIELRQSLNEPGEQNKGLATNLARSSPGQRDRELLEFAVKHPEYLDRLQGLGLEDVLSTQRGRQFWKKLIHYGEGAVLPYLDQGEKQFFVHSRMRKAEHDDPERVFEDICHFVAQTRRVKDRKTLQEALSQAQIKGDLHEQARLLEHYSNLVKGAE
jgi:DNA primase